MNAPRSDAPTAPPELVAGGPGVSRSSSSLTRVGLTEKLAVASARRPGRTLVIWATVVVVALVLVGTSLKGLTTSAHVVGTTESSQAQALYDQVVGSSTDRKPTDVIVLSSKTSTVSAPAFQGVVSRLLTEVRTSPGVTNVVTDLSPGSPFVSSNQHAALIELRVASDAEIKPVVKAVHAAGAGVGVSAAVTGEHTVGNDFTIQSASDLKHGELDFGVPVSLVVLLLVFGAVIAGLMPVLLAIVSIVVGLGITALLAQEFSLSTFIVNIMTGMGLALGIDYSLFILSRFREEQRKGLDKDAAIARAGATASRAVLFSGTTFVIALLGMFVFIHGIGARLFGFQQVSFVDAWIPLFLFSVLFALSMDYQVFLMSRIKERYDQTGSMQGAVASGVVSTARIITGAALIIVAVFAGFARGQLVQFQQMGFGIAVALLLDATLIRMVILPSMLSLLDRRSWYLPRWLGWLSHLLVESPEFGSADGSERPTVLAASTHDPSTYEMVSS